MNKTLEQKQLDFEVMQIKAEKNGFELTPFTGFALIEVDSGADLYFENLNDVNNYINACDLSDAELQKRYDFVTDSEIDGDFEQKRAEIEQKMNQGARLTERKLHL